MKYIWIAVVASLLIAVPALAETEEPEPAQEFEDQLEHHAEELGLDDATRAKIDALVEQTRPARHARREQMRRERGRLRELLSAPEPNLDAVLAQADVISKLESEGLRSRLRTTVEIRGLLSPEQRAKLVSRSNEMRNVHERRRSERLLELQTACGNEIAAACDEWREDARSLRRCLLGSASVSPACAEQLSETRGERRMRRKPL